MQRIWISETPEKVGEKVSVAGFVHSRRDHGKLIFIDLRDRSGVLQIVFKPQDVKGDDSRKLRGEWVIAVEGVVKERPENMENPELVTGKIELSAENLQVLSEAETPPFDLSTDGYEVNEEIRMKYRYLDLRRDRLRQNLRMRAKVIKFIRDFLTGPGLDFTEVETPILSKSTPEGARDYLVPSRIYNGKFYALPQSPQQYKQLLMVAGIERYFQIARCFRDEDTRGDRQPEFTQLDLEMSFISEDDILNLTQDLFIALVKELYPKKKIQKIPFPRLSFKEAMEKYNSDKPDLRKDKNDPDELAFAFIVNFPAFEWKEQEKRWDAVHHPFTMPQVKDASDFQSNFKKDPASILAHQYDFVLNGYEIGGGSIRIHNSELLATVFEAMGNKPEEVREKFGHMLEAFTYGVPPHGGIAPGIDRFVMIMQNEPNIREVFSFPKTGDGRDLMMSSPSAVDPAQLGELGISINKKAKE